MIYNTRSWGNDTTVRRKEKKACFNAYFQYSQSKIMDKKGAYFRNKIWSLKSLAQSKCKSRTSLHAVQYNLQPGSVLMFCSYYFKNG